MDSLIDGEEFVARVSKFHAILRRSQSLVCVYFHINVRPALELQWDNFNERAQSRFPDTRRSSMKRKRRIEHRQTERNEIERVLVQTVRSFNVCLTPVFFRLFITFLFITCK